MKISLKILVLLSAIIYFSCLMIPDIMYMEAFGSNESAESELFVPGSSISGIETAAETGELTYNILDEGTGEIIKVSERDFLISTVALELSPLVNEEALKAQAVAARSFYRYKKSTAGNGEYDFICDSEEPYTYAPLSFFEEKWGENYRDYLENIVKAVDGTENLLLTYSGEVACASYFAISNGSTENAEDVWDTSCPYLISVASPYDALSPGYESTVSISPEKAMDTAVNFWPDGNFDFSLPYESWFTDITYNSGCSVKSVNICGFSVTGREVREAFSLRSATFEVKYEDGVFLFSTRGYGHGVGMSQTGASFMAESGCDFYEILSFYYPGTEVTDISA